MKKFLVITKEKVVINGKTYLYHHIISVSNKDKKTLSYCLDLVKAGKLREYK